MQTPEALIAPLHYIPRHVETPVVRNSKYGDDSIRNFAYQALPTAIHDGRADADAYSLDVHGFQLIQGPTTLPAHLRESDPEIKRDYYPEVEQILKGATGADEVLIFDHTVRTEDLFSTRRPVRHAHNDYTDRSAPQRVRDLLGDAEAEKRFQGRVMQINLWRPFGSPVYSSPLALAAANSVRPSDLRHTALIYDDRRGEVFELQYDPAQHWVTFPRMTPEEALLIKGYDSRETGVARFTPHTGFDDPTTPPGAPPRRSIETRAFLFFTPN